MSSHLVRLLLNDLASPLYCKQEWVCGVCVLVERGKARLFAKKRTERVFVCLLGAHSSQLNDKLPLIHLSRTACLRQLRMRRLVLRNVNKQTSLNRNVANFLKNHLRNLTTLHLGQLNLTQECFVISIVSSCMCMHLWRNYHPKSFFDKLTHTTKK